MDLIPHIIFEDSDMLVVNKPAGMIVNRSDTTKAVKTLQEWAEEHTGTVSSKINELSSEFEKRGGIVHRLDKETSGIIVIAKNEESFENLKSQFKGRNVKKTYLTLLHGDVVPTTGEINAPIGRLPWNRTRFGVLPEGREATSAYKVLEVRYEDDGKEKEALTLVEFYPTTGRTHQIRVHARHIGYPVFADELYSGRKTAKRDRKVLPRQFLHAIKLVINHPKTQESMTFNSELPTDLQNLLDSLSK